MLIIRKICFAFLTRLDFLCEMKLLRHNHFKNCARYAHVFLNSVIPQQDIIYFTHKEILQKKNVYLFYREKSSFGLLILY